MSYFAGESKIVDRQGNEAEVGLFGSLKVSQALAQINLTFDRALDTANDVVKATTGLGTAVAQYNRSLLRVKTGGAGTADIETKAILRYKTATTIETNFTASFVGTTGTGDIAYIGLFDDEDGVFLGMNGTDFVVGYRNINKDGGTEPDVTQVIDMSAYTLTNIHRFRIRFGYLGVGSITYEIHDGIRYRIIHTFVTDASMSDRTHVGTPLLPMRCELSSSANDIEILSGSWGTQTYSLDDKLQDKAFNHSGQRTVTPTTSEGPIVGFRSKTTFNGYNSKIRSKLLYAEFATGCEGLYAFSIYPVAAGTITGTFNDIDANSVMEVSVDLTDVPSGAPKFVTYVAVSSSGTGVGRANIDFEALGLVASPGDEFIISIKGVIIGTTTNDQQAWSFAYADLF